MSQFNQQLELARKRQHRMYLWLLTSFVLVFLIIMTVIFASRGTRVEVQPDDASDSGDGRRLLSSQQNH